MKVEALWISDVHLGSRGCKAEQLLELLKIAGGSKEEAKFTAPAQSYKILEWCESKKY